MNDTLLSVMGIIMLEITAGDSLLEVIFLSYLLDARNNINEELGEMELKDCLSKCQGAKLYPRSIWASYYYEFHDSKHWKGQG